MRSSSSMDPFDLFRREHSHSQTMEKKAQDSSLPTVLDFFRTEELETSSSKPDFEEQGAKNGASRLREILRLLRIRSKKSMSNLNPFSNNNSALKNSMRRCSSMRETIGFDCNFVFNDARFHLVSPRRIFTLAELQSATDNFAFDNLIGKGGYAEVFKGRLQNGQLVAIKRLTRGTTDEIIVDFLSEMGMMAHVNHPNVAKLFGYGIEGGMHLVLELSPHGSLASMLYGSREKIDWGVRYKIALGTAEGLVYLHRGCQRRIIHRDIKAANILLTQDFQPQICDFGLAKWLPEHWTHHIVSKFEGTFGYLAPEYMTYGIVDEKTDVFAFGVLLLELVTGRRALDYSRQSLVLWAKPLMKKNKIRELIDPSLANAYDTRQMKLVLLAASLCIQQSSIQRPQMSQVLEILKGNLNDLKCIKKCRVSFFRKAFRDEIIVTEMHDHKSPKI
ncbi:PREDICTED: receptor-like cytosolic serine/threonine-protein kinase RBK2 [Tarenaya hassleriana]|uniref:receptor-like cytosolic serine/threonine-protein kinase RBK2 n=1 Tax=Tarenaya hassleriana TaxID=28532 RepID=UPI00053CA7C9|nr:PREDICTED: receptor-like cytosolic serine/threonine-protein kinase RBK2 [Tarenaya hassleriana]